MYQIKGISLRNFGKNKNKKIMGVILWKKTKTIIKKKGQKSLK